MATSLGDVAEATVSNLTDTGQAPVKCMFRPNQYVFTKQLNWNPNQAVGKSVNKPTYTGSPPQNITLDLFFDTHETGQDVREQTKPLWRWAHGSVKKKEQNTNKDEPPLIEFRWGKLWSVKAVIQSISETFTLFLTNGTPVRSKVHLALIQAEDEEFPGQNPTSRGREGYAVHIVKEGETIDWIAFSEYGNSNAWRHLADANRIDDPERLRPGQPLLIVPVD